jgi:protein tyrosine/serine phosphatase
MNNARLLSRLRATVRAGLYLIIVLAVSAGGWAGFLQLTGNIHAVSEGAVYRSAQLNGERLAVTLKQYQIKSVINLRGDSVGDEWYTNELNVTAAQGAVHYDIGMYAKQEPDTATVKRIFEVLRTAPRPLLIHCNSGSDRTGLVAAIYEHFVEGRSADEAAAQLSFRFGHFPWLGSGTVAMDHAFEHLVAKGDAKAALP